jgi:hypothetical protein
MFVYFISAEIAVVVNGELITMIAFDICRGSWIREYQRTFTREKLLRQIGGCSRAIWLVDLLASGAEMS